MTVTITYDGATPTVGADADTWGTELNTGALAKIKVDLDAIATQYNITQPLAAAALPKSGGTLTGDVAVGDPTPASASSIGFRGFPASLKNSAYTLVLKDNGKLIYHESATAHVWTIPPNSSVAFPIGTQIALSNTGSGTVTLSRGSGVTLFSEFAGTDATMYLLERHSCLLLKVGTNSWSASAGATY